MRLVNITDNQVAKSSGCGRVLLATGPNIEAVETMEATPYAVPQIYKGFILALVRKH